MLRNVGPFLDLYVLCPARTVVLARHFLDTWAPARVASFADVTIHPSGDTIDATADFLAALAARPDQEGGLYWASGRADLVAHVMLHFTTDGGLIAGLSVGEHEQPRAQVAASLERLARSVTARFGYVGFEEPPVIESRAAFLAMCGRRELRLVDGVVSDG